MPVKRVVLYKNGVGYFEHLGRVRDKQDVAISFTSGQLNDVLKSLTVLDLGGGRITGVGYGSSAPVDRQLGDLRLPVGEKATLTEFLGALRGSKIEVRSGTNVITGRLLSIERKTRMGGGATLEVEYLALVTDAGEVRTTELSPQFSVRLLERGLVGKVDRYLDLAASAREADQRRMVISTDGTGERPLFVSYISEVPVWKATYRIVLGGKPGQSPLLQGWAIVDNTVGQDWDNVQLSLVAGAPQSFIQKLSQPYYARRPVVPLPESFAGTPQTFESTLIAGGAGLAGLVTDPTGAGVAGASVKAFDPNGTLAAETNTGAGGTFELALPDGSYRLDVSMAGFKKTQVSSVNVAGSTRQDVRLDVGDVSDSVTVSAAPSTIQTETAAMSRSGSRDAGSGGALGSGAGLGGGLREGVSRKTAQPAYDAGQVQLARARSESSANARELGDLFEYKLKEPVSIAKNRSALVPIVQSAIGAEKVSLWNESAGLSRPLRALWLTNSSGLTLDGGAFSVIEGDAFAGEGIIELIRPGEKRLASYASDLALTVREKATVDRQRVSRVRVALGTMIHESEIRETRTYTARNEDTSPRALLIEHPVRNGYALRGGLTPVETTSGWMRFKIDIAPKQTGSLEIAEARAVQASYAITNINWNVIAEFATAKSITPEIEAALRKILEQKQSVAGLESNKEALESESTKIFDDQQRLRENMKALKGSAEEKVLLQRYTQQLNEQETRLDALRKETAALETRIEQAEEALDKMIAAMSFDVRL